MPPARRTIVPYRSRKQQERRAAPKRGLVADMVRQFADPHAFLRELVQNAIDAGTSRIDVTIELRGGRRAFTRLSDDGSGMTQSIVENNLCTLFSSTKESDGSKVGKYGVGFVSVLGVNPDQVEVRTWREASTLLLTLHSDHRWELEQEPTRAGSGTEVTLTHTMDRESFGAHAAACVESLRRWCRHVAVPIAVTVFDDGNPSYGGTETINAPFTVFSPVTVEVEDRDTRYVVGCAAGSNHVEPEDHVSPAELEDEFAGFYNRGLTLFESTTERFGSLEGVRFKVSSPAFEHTLSRDNVRRDAHFDRAIAKVRRLVRRDLKSRLADELARVARGGPGAPPERYLALLTAAMKAPLTLTPAQLALALVDPVDDETALDLASLVWKTPWTEPVLVAEASTPLTRALADSGRPVMWDRGRQVTNLVARALHSSRTLAGASHAAVDSYCTLYRPLSRPTPSDRALCTAVHRALESASLRIAGVVLVEVSGRPLTHASTLLRGAGPWLRLLGEGVRRPSARTTVALNVAHAAIDRARQTAAKRPGATAQLIARLALVEMGRAPSARVNDRLLAHLLGEQS
jgi:hypothetical protein